MNAVIGTNKVGTLFNEIAHLSYIVEEFHPLEADLGTVIVHGEMLARDPDNAAPKGYLFDQARECGQIIPADLLALGVAIKQHLALAKSNSINLNAETFFSPELIVKLDQLKTKNLQLDPTRIWLEITEQGGVPSNANTAALKSLTDRGYRLALDDFDIDNPKEHARIEAFGDHLSVVKLDHTYAEKFRFGAESKRDDLGKKIHAITDRFPNIITVLEGVTGSDKDLFPAFHKAGVKVVQQSGYCGNGPVKAISSQEIMELALHH